MSKRQCILQYGLIKELHGTYISKKNWVGVGGCVEEIEPLVPKWCIPMLPWETKDLFLSPVYSLLYPGSLHSFQRFVFSRSLHVSPLV